MAFADTLAGVCAHLNLPTGAGTATISSSTNMLGRAGRSASPLGGGPPNEQ
jgi:acyl-coenzyme A thioesterase PaaI-like protein